MGTGRGLVAAAALFVGACASTPPVSALSPSAREASLRALIAADDRVVSIAFRLAAAGADICPRTAPLAGLTLHAPSQYAPALREAARTLAGLRDRTSVLALAPASPAAKAGLRPGDGLVQINDTPVPTAERGRAGSYAEVAAAYALLERELRSRTVRIRVDRDGGTLDLMLVPVPGCASRVQLVPSPRVHAKADGAVLSVTTGLLAYVASDDELALVIAHEMAHNALGHRARLDAAGARRNLFGSYGSDTALVRETERAADRLAYFLMNRAGYDHRVAEAFWTRLHRGPASGTSASESHPDLAARLVDYRRAAIDIERARTAGALPTP